MPSLWKRLVAKTKKKPQSTSTPTGTTDTPNSTQEVPHPPSSQENDSDNMKTPSFRLLRAPTLAEIPRVTSAQNVTASRLLQLPGELRNQIYTYVIYPRLDAIIITDMVVQHHYSRKALRLGIFRASHQLRNEALSYLAADKHFKICGIQSAVDFFLALGPAIADLKRVTVAMTHVGFAPLSNRNLDMFTSFLGKAAALRYFKLEIGRPSFCSRLDDEYLANDFLLVERVWKFVKGREDLEFEWAAGAYDSQYSEGTHEDRIKVIRQIFGEEFANGNDNEKGVMYVW
ncbi:hypothetical protein BDU57DRAFT_549927 [Ampelomyces quisqualis]|uniref:F-box domain-containing protein n=1 Tax=Ampelomyces quisqualis TaxID=50730 RepID=A0A6A5QH14_AMPQU|nr:hypothetical protein BDU57DRAFT_549927 [Ampelomyces quisqualis]